MIWYIFILSNDYNRLVNIVPSHNYGFCVCGNVTREPVPNSGSAAHCLKISKGGKGEVALVRKAATWEHGGLTSQKPRVLKGKAQEKGGELSAGEAGAQAVSRTLIGTSTDLLASGAAVFECGQALSSG